MRGPDPENFACAVLARGVLRRLELEIDVVARIRRIHVAPDFQGRERQLTDRPSIENASRHDAVHAALVLEQGRIARGRALTHARLECLQHAALLGVGRQRLELG